MTEELTIERPRNGGGVAMLQGATRNGFLGRIEGTRELTEMQSQFVKNHAKGISQAQSAKLAGYSQPDCDGSRLMLLPHVRKAVADERERNIFGNGASSAYGVMLEIMEDKSEKSQVRVQCAKWFLEAAGHGLAARVIEAGIVQSDKPLADMTLGELDATIAEIDTRMRAMRIVQEVSQSAHETPATAIATTPQSKS